MKCTDKRKIELLGRKEIIAMLVEYEVSQHLWMRHISNKWVQKMIGRLFSYLVGRKIRRHKAYLQKKVELKELKEFIENNECTDHERINH
jgi:hypothetical protein